MSIDADPVDPPTAERRIVWFRGGERPVGGGGNTVFVRPEEPAVTDECTTADADAEPGPGARPPNPAGRGRVRARV